MRELEKGDPLSTSHDESHILAAACLASARRNIHEATPALERLLGSAHPAPRAAAAAALLSLGWGIGMGHVSSGAAKVLESMLGGHLQASKARSLRQLSMRPTLTQDASRLAASAAAAQAAWDEAVLNGDEGAAVAAAIRLTACRVAARGGDEKSSG